MITLSVQNEIIVCPDCGQRYDPAKAAALPRVRARDGRTMSLANPVRGNRHAIDR